jgi:hypothetical protein
MNYKIDQVDMEIRERINDAGSEERIHRKKQIGKINGKKSEDRKYEGKGEQEKFVVPENPSKNSKITVISVKDNNKSINVEAIKENDDTSIIDEGNFLDVRR